MRRNVTAAVVQLTGIAIIVAGSFAISAAVGVVALGLVVLLLGIDLEGDR